MTDPAVRFEGITKRFPGVTALAGVTLEVAAGSCHALCGENGAGKSTLGKILAGIYRPDGGRLEVRGRPVHFSGPRDALAAGIGIVHQELAFCPNLTIAENLCLGALPKRGWTLDRATLRRRAVTMLDAIGIELDVRRFLGELTIAQQQQVQIAAAVGSGASIIVFDEPTSSLSQLDAERLYGVIGTLRSRGVTCLYVSHRMPEIFRLCDRVTVLRDGHQVLTEPIDRLTPDRMARAMVGRAIEPAVSRHRSALGKEMLTVAGLSRSPVFENVSFSLRAGEVLGLAGLVGAGRSEIARVIFGVDRRQSGRILVRGREVVIRSPADAIRLGFGLVPEDRKHQGIVPSETTVRNISLPILSRLTKWRWLRPTAERRVAGEYAERVRLRKEKLDLPIAGLSGGNQQKVILARWLAAESDILILDEPTRGVDVGAKAEIHGKIGELAAAGKAILMISSELPELLAVSTRILVLRAGRIVGEVSPEQATEGDLLGLMAGL